MSIKKLVPFIGLVLPIALAGNAFAVTGPVTPASITATLTAGASTVVTTVVQTPSLPANPDLVFLADTTGSMGGAIGNVQANSLSVRDAILAANPNAEFGVVQYKDFGDSVPYLVNQNLTADKDKVTAGINAWSASGGGDYPEAQINALYHLATDITWRSDSNHIVAWFGDAPGHDPSNGITLDQAIAALVAAHIRVIAVTVGDYAAHAALTADAVQPPGDGLDDNGQATKIVTATGGVLMTSSGDVTAAILEGLKALPVTVVPSYSGDTHLTAAFDPPQQTVASGAPATFKETFTVTTDAPAGTTLNGTVSYKLNGAVGTGYSQTIAITTPKGAVLAATAGPTGPAPLGLTAILLLLAGLVFLGAQRVRSRADAR